MSDAATTPRARRTRNRGLKTWTAFGNLGRRPTDYEVVTHNLNHTTGPVPLEMSPDAPGNRWLIEHRDSTALHVPDWDAFRDPDAVTYGSYVAMQDDEETYVEKLLEQFDADDYDAGLSAAALDLLEQVVTPSRYLAHGLQMLSAYVQQLAPTSYVSTAAAFQTADQLRRLQLTAYRTVQLQRTHPDRGFGAGERARWETDPDWTVVRETIERAMVEYDWDRALVATQLVVKPVLDVALLDQLGRGLASAGAVLDALIAENLAKDAQRSRRWTSTLATFLAEADPANTVVLQGILDEWAPLGSHALQAAARLVGRAGGRPADAVVADVLAEWQELLRPAGLTLPGAVS